MGGRRAVAAGADVHDPRPQRRVGPPRRRAVADGPPVARWRWPRSSSDVRFALQKLCDRTLRGMFDGPTNVAVDWRDGPGVVLDLSAVHNDAAGAAAGDAGRHLLAGRGDAPPGPPEAAGDRRGVGGGPPRRRLHPVVAEAGPRSGVSPTCSSATDPRDLAAQNDDGTASSKIAAGLLADIETRVLLRQPAEEVPAMAELFDLSEREQDDAVGAADRPGDLEDRAPLGGRADGAHPDRDASCSTPTRRWPTDAVAAA